MGTSLVKAKREIQSEVRVLFFVDAMLLAWSRILPGWLCAALLLSWPTSAAAQVMQATEPELADTPAERPYAPARVGFQMAARAGLRFPAGKATAEPGDTLARRYSYQLPLALDVGYKLSRHVLVGGYLGFAYGAEGSQKNISGYCEDDDSGLNNDVSCTVFDYRMGIMGQYQFLPSGKYNPWLGYGFGVEAASQTLNDKPRGFRENTLTIGVTYAKIDGGMDFRGKDGLGFGLYSEAAIGRYVRSRTQINGYTTYVGSIDDPEWHVWLGGGIRAVLLP